MKTIFEFTVAICLLFLSLPSLGAAVATGNGTLTYIENGWYGDGFAIHHTNSVSGCLAPPTEYGLQPSHPQYKEIVAMLIAAFVNGTTVELVADSGVCVLGNRTKIISIRLKK